MDVKGRWSVVTGAGNGIGRAIAIALAQRGSSIVVLDIHAEGAEQTAALVREQGVEAQVQVLDLCDTEKVQQVVKQLCNDLDVAVAVNNAGIGARSPLINSTEEDMRWTFEVNFMAVCRLCAVFGRHMAERDAPGWIVNTGSEHSLGVPHQGNAIYTASKHAVHGLSDVMRRELPDHVGISLLCPGLVSTSIWRSSERRSEAYGGATPANPAAEPFMQLGMDPAEVGERVALAIEKQQFYIFTHAHVAAYAEERHRAVEQAFAKQVPRYAGDERYDASSLRASMISKGESR